MYVVVAVAKRDGPAAVLPGPGWRVGPTVVAVGIRHALPRLSFAPPPVSAVCGADIKDWLIFEDSEFDPRHPASCQRCAQLTPSTSTRRKR